MKKWFQYKSHISKTISTQNKLLPVTKTMSNFKHGKWNYLKVLLIISNVVVANHTESLNREKRFFQEVNIAKVYKAMFSTETISNQFTFTAVLGFVKIIGYLIGGKYITIINYLEFCK